MPIFDFVCEVCNEAFEALVMGSKPYCPKCKSEKLKKKMSSFSVGGRGESSGTGSGAKCAGCAGGSCNTCQ